MHVVVTRIRSHCAHAYTKREEDLAAGLSPHLSVFQFGADVGSITLCVVALEVHADTSVSVIESKTVHDHDENEEYRHWDGYPDDI